MDERQYLIQEIELFCNQSGIAESTFGRQTVNDGKFVGRLRDGKGVTTATVAKVRRYLLDSYFIFEELSWLKNKWWFFLNTEEIY